MNLIEVRKAVKKFGKCENSNFVLNGLSMEVGSASIYALIGASGCGKTTLISCILGMKSLDEGSIHVLGEKITHMKTNSVTRFVGYMPQKVELVAQLTAKETLKYFGNIFQMDKDEFIKRYEMLKDLLELDFEDRKISQISGGEQRRVSLAVAFIHNPRVLILDEPTVGLDVVLRNKIWNFMLDATKSHKLSILITTHYIAEAQLASRCGFMRSGILIAEDTPMNIITRLRTVNLDESFLQLCTSEQQRKCFTIEPKAGFGDVDVTVTLNNEKNMQTEMKKRKPFSRSTMRALFKKEMLRFKRSGEISLMIILPLAQILVLAFALGRAPTGLKLGVLNNEDPGMTQNDSLLSNLFLDEITEEKSIKVFYDSFDEVFKDAKRGKLVGFIEIAKNFTEIFLESNLPLSDRNADTTNAVDVHLDKSNHQISFFMTQSLYDAYFRFDKEFMNKSVEDYPIRVETCAVFLCSIVSTSVVLTASRDEGVWNRTLLAGTKLWEVLFAQLVILTCQNLFQILEIILVSGFFIEMKIFDDFFILLALCMSIATVGSSYALLTSILIGNFVALFMVNSTFFMTIMVLSGIVWPIEGQPEALQYISLALPTTFASISGRDILLKDFGIFDWTVQRGFIILAVWMVLCNIFTLTTLRKNKFV